MLSLEEFYATDEFFEDEHYVDESLEALEDLMRSF